MLRVAVKPSSLMRVDAFGPRAVCAAQGVARSSRYAGSVHTRFSPHARSGADWGPMTQSSPSIRTHALRRGPQRLCSLDPDTVVTVPPLWRYALGDPAQIVRVTRVSAPDERVMPS